MTFVFTHPNAKQVTIKASSKGAAWEELKRTAEYRSNKAGWKLRSDWSESTKLIGSLLIEFRGRRSGTTGSRGDSYNDHEVEIDGRNFLLTGTVEATVINDSDMNRETGYGRLVYLDDFQYNITRIEEILQDGSTVDVSSDKGVIEMVEDFMKSDLENQFSSE